MCPKLFKFSLKLLNNIVRYVTIFLDFCSVEKILSPKKEDKMNNKTKKILCSALASILTLSSHAVFSANVGDVVGKVLSTDIVTYIDGIQVPSFNINGRTAIVVENLNAMGLSFGVSYDDSNRMLTIAGSDIYQTGGLGYFHFENSVSSLPVGTPVMDVLYTDIKTVFNTAVLESFNIGGFTCIYSDDLAKQCGTYVWDEAARTVNVYRDGVYVPSISKVNSYHVLDADDSVITKSQTFDRWGKAATSHLIPNSDGSFTAVEVSEHINIENYDSSFNHLSSFAIKKELPLFGGLYVGKDYNYIAFGQENLLEDNSREVIKIAIYDKSFVKISEVSINNCKTAVPFDASGGEMFEDERYLVLHTSRSQYADENGSRPQTQLTVIIDKTSWKPVNILSKFQYNHTSHALREFVRIDDGRLITANFSDAAPLRGAFLQELDFSGKVLYTQSIFNVGGPAGANCTGAMIGGFEVSPEGYLVSMNTIDHALATGYSNVNIEGIDRENRDIYLLWTDKNTWEQRHTCLARYTGVGSSGSVPYLVKLPDSKFMVLWQRFNDYSEDSNTLCYAIADSEGNQLGKTYSVSGRLSSSCKPVVSNGKVVWYVNSENGREFYSIDADVSAIMADSENLKNDSMDTDTSQENPKNEQTKPEKDKITEVDGI